MTHSLGDPFLESTTKLAKFPHKVSRFSHVFMNSIASSEPAMSLSVEYVTSP